MGFHQDGKITWVAQPDQPGKSTFFFGSTLPEFLVETWALPHIPPYWFQGWVLLVGPCMSQTCFHPAQAAVGCLLWQGSKFLKWHIPKPPPAHYHAHDLCHHSAHGWTCNYLYHIWHMGCNNDADFFLQYLNALGSTFDLFLLHCSSWDLGRSNEAWAHPPQYGPCDGHYT